MPASLWGEDQAALWLQTSTAYLWLETQYQVGQLIVVDLVLKHAKHMHGADHIVRGLQDCILACIAYYLLVLHLTSPQVEEQESCLEFIQGSSEEQHMCMQALKEQMTQTK